jgi:hypothetical protein
LSSPVWSGVFLATTGAFGSAGAPYVQRLAYWVLMMILGGLWGHLCSRIVGRGSSMWTTAPG